MTARHPTPEWWTQTRAELQPALRQLRVAIYASGGAPYHHSALIAHWGGVPEPLDATEIRAGALDAYDVLVVPGGGLQAMGGLLSPLGTAGTAQMRAWVERGGMYIGSCAGAYLGASLPPSFIDANPAARELQLLDLPIANAAEGVLGGLDSPGVGVLEACLTSPTSWLARGLPECFEMVHYNGPCFLPQSGSGVQGAVTLRAATERFTPWEHSLPDHSHEGPVLSDTLVSQGVQLAVSGRCGAGTVVLFGSHPEFGFSSLQLGWGIAARLFGNALAHQAERRSSGGAGTRLPPSWTSLGETAQQLVHAAHRFEALHRDPPDLAGAPAFMGLQADVLWTLALKEAADLCASTAAYLKDLTTAQPQSGIDPRWLDHQPEPGQDYGFVGLVQLVQAMHRLIDSADAQLHECPPAQTFPYDSWDRHPYHLLASSYLSAAGLAACVSLCAGTIGQLGGFPAPAPHPLAAARLDIHQGVHS